MTGQLFTHYFLTDGIKATAEWQASLAQPEAFIAFKDGVARHHDALSRSRNPNEARTEEELIRPVLELLGWTEYVPQPSAAGHEDIPDHLIFADADSKARVGNPFIWDEEERRHLRARLDALYFHLYGLSRDDAEYVLNTFPIVRREDEAAFGTYRTRDMTLAYMNALAAGDVEVRVAV